MSFATAILISVTMSVNFLELVSAVPIEVTDFRCTKQNKTVCANNLCNITKVDQGLSLINFYCYFEKPVATMAGNVILARKEKNIYKKWLINIEQDVCRLFAGTSYSTVFLKLLSGMAKYASFVHPCPFVGDFSVIGYPLDLTFIPAVLPKGQFRLTAIVKSTSDKSIYFIAQAFFTLK